jgi:hypothetical protein
MPSSQRRVVFLGHSFAVGDRAIVAVIKRVLRTSGCSVVSGEAPEALRVSEKIRKRIESADAFVALFTRRHSIGDSRWTTSPWVVEEKAYSFGVDASRPIVVLVEDGISIPEETGGLNGDLEYISFDRHGLDICRRKLRAMIDQLWK